MDNKIENLNIISEQTKITGTLEVQNYTRFHGCLKGTILGHPNSELIIGVNGVVEGNITADLIIIDGFVRGDICATSGIKISSTGRVIGNIKSSNLSLEFGAYFEGTCYKKSSDLRSANA